MLNSALLTDFYQVTMAYGYWKTKRHELPSVFTLHFRSNPFHGGFSLLAGIDPALAFMENFALSEEDLRFLGSLKASNGETLFESGFLAYLKTARFACDVEAVAEGTVVFPHEPILKVRGPLWQCQWMETALLNIINFQTLIATKSARIVSAARGGDVLEFGLRRAQGFDGALSASRAAYIGGASATSNLLAAKEFDIPLRGTHGHSWIMSFESEQEAFDQYALALPNDCVLLVDTYDSLRGVRHAVETAKKLSRTGKKLSGIRLDSGDFAYLSTEARKTLDQAGLTDAKIVASNELDEHLIQSLHVQQAKIDSWGVGTKLVTADDQPAMTGVYKLSAIQRGNEWQHTIKVSNQPAKTTNPGIQKLRRYVNSAGHLEADLIYDESEAMKPIDKIIDPLISARNKRIKPEWTSQELLQPVFRRGTRIAAPTDLKSIRAHALRQISSLHPSLLRLENPHAYPVGLSPFLSELKARLIKEREAE